MRCEQATLAAQKPEFTCARASTPAYSVVILGGLIAGMIFVGGCER